MASRNINGAAGHFGRQMKKERLARGWSLLELGRRTGLDAAHLGRVESGQRPPTEKIAGKCDAVFPERGGWFGEFYAEMRDWPEIPASFRSWPEFEDKAARLFDWSPSIITGLLQTEDYARTLLATFPEVTPDTVTTRLASRMERQRRVLMRAGPPAAWFIVDEFSLYRLVGSPEIMAAQMRHLAEMAALPRITIQVLPAVAHSANGSGFLIADEATWVEHIASGFVYTDAAIVSTLSHRFDSLRAESYRGSESLQLIERLERSWATGASPLTRTLPGETA